MRDLFANLNYIFLQPAYGRSYATAEQVLKDWKAGKDFKILHGPYCSIRDREDMLQHYQNPTILLEYKPSIFVTL
jgi:hypothetical protein